MKMTMHIGEALLAKVMAAHCGEGKTGAVGMALREMARKEGFPAMVAAPSPFSPAELRAVVEPSYDMAALRAAEPRAIYSAQSAGAALLTDDQHFDHMRGLQILRPSDELHGWCQGESEGRETSVRPV